MHMATLIFFRSLCGYVWVNILTVSPPRVNTREEQNKTLTELSSPSVRSIMKKMSDQNVDAGRVAMASGYTTNTRPGPENNRTITGTGIYLESTHPRLCIFFTLHPFHWQVCLTLLHMTSTWNRTKIFWSLAQCPIHLATWIGCIVVLI